MLIIFSFIAVSTVCCIKNSCEFVTGTAYNYDDVVNCLNSVQITKEEQDTVISILKQYQENIIFKDIFINPPDPNSQLAVNISTEIEKLGNRTYSSANEFYQNISAMYLKLKDPHDIFCKPCSRNISFILPFSIRASINSEDNKISLMFDSLPKSQQFVTKTYVDSDEKNLDLTGYSIIGINPDGGEIGESNPEDVIMQWADLNIFHSKYSPARFNRAVWQDFIYRPQIQYNIPTKSFITVKVKKPLQSQSQSDNDEDEIEVQLPWYATVRSNFTSMDQICPLNQSLLNGMKQQQDHNNKKVGKKSQQNERPLHRMMQEYYTISNLDSFDNTLEIENNKIIKEEGDDLILVFGDEFIQYYYKNSVKTGYLRISSFYPNNTQEGVKEFANFVHQTFQDLHNKNGDKLVVDLRQNGGGFVGLGMRSLQHISGNSFYPVVGQYDIRHSPIHDQLNDNNLLTKVDHIEYLTQKPLKKKWYNPGIDREFTTKNESIELVSNFGKEKVQENDIFSHKYSSRYTVNIFDDEEQFESIYKPLKESPEYPLDQQHLIFVTDGFLGSTAACFLKRVQEAHVGKIIALGLDPYIQTFKQKHNQIYQTSPYFDVASFAGGSVLDSDYIQELIKQNPKEILTQAIPQEFPRFGSLLRWAFEEIYSYSFDTKDLPLEFKVNEPDYIIQYFPAPYDEFKPPQLSKVLDLVSPKFSECAPWEVLQNSSCDPDEKKMPFAIYGRPCNKDTKTFDKTQCVFSRCKSGYYLHPETEKCTVIPKDYKRGLTMTEIIIITAICLGVLISTAIVVITIVLIVKHTKKRRSYQQLP